MVVFGVLVVALVLALLGARVGTFVNEVEGSLVLVLLVDTFDDDTEGVFVLLLVLSDFGL